MCICFAYLISSHSWRMLIITWLSCHLLLYFGTNAIILIHSEKTRTIQWNSTFYAKLVLRRWEMYSNGQWPQNKHNRGALWWKTFWVCIWAPIESLTFNCFQSNNAYFTALFAQPLSQILLLQPEHVHQNVWPLSNTTNSHVKHWQLLIFLWNISFGICFYLAR